jgi:hypothetical protein
MKLTDHVVWMCYDDYMQTVVRVVMNVEISDRIMKFIVTGK